MIIMKKQAQSQNIVNSKSMKIIHFGSALFVVAITGTASITGIYAFQPQTTVETAHTDGEFGMVHEILNLKDNNDYEAAPKNPLNVEVIRMEPIYAADFSDDQVLIGASHNIFVGTVIAANGNKERDLGPETQFQVEVIENIKGDLKGTIIVNQQGGYKDDELYVFGDTDAESYLLKPGATYLLSTRVNDKEGWYTLNPHPNASKLLSARPLDAEKRLEVIASDQKISELKTAYPNEVLLRADVKNANVRNSYRAQELARQASDTPKDTLGLNDMALIENQILEVSPEENQSQTAP